MNTTRKNVDAALSAAGIDAQIAWCRAGRGYWYFYGGEADDWRESIALGLTLRDGPEAFVHDAQSKKALAA